MALIRREDVWALVGDHVMTVRPGSKLEWALHHYANAIDGAPEVDAVPIADAKAIVDIALYAISKMENFGCAYVWEKSGDPYADENNIRGECQEYRRKIKDMTGRWCCNDGTD